MTGVQEKFELVIEGQSLGHFTRSGLRGAFLEIEKILGKPIQAEPEQIIEGVCDHFGLTVKQVKAPGRSAKVAWPRQVAMCLLIECGLSQSEAGSRLGRSDHGTARWGQARVYELCQTDPKRAASLAHLRAKLMCKDQDAAE